MAGHISPHLTIRQIVTCSSTVCPGIRGEQEYRGVPESFIYTVLVTINVFPRSSNLLIAKVLL